MFVAQYKVTRWCNFTDAKDNKLLFDTEQEAETYIYAREAKRIAAGRGRKPGSYRVAEFLGGRQYKEVKTI